MSENKGNEIIEPSKMKPGFCSATCVDRESLQKEISKPEIKTSDKFITCNLPKRFEHPRKCGLQYFNNKISVLTSFLLL